MVNRLAAILLTVVLLTSAILGVLSATPAAVAGTEATAAGDGTDASAPTRLTDCATITEPGEYVLASDVRNGSAVDPESGLGGCIAIRTSDVTLRGGNHTVAAGPDGRPGVVGVLVGRAGDGRADGSGGVDGGRAGDGGRLSNVTVRNLTTTRWGAGVALFGVADAALRNVSAVSNLGDGVFAERTPGLGLVGGTVRGSNTGVFLRDAPGARVAGLTVAENIAGVSVRRSDGATVSRIEATGNRQFGVGVFASADTAVADSVVSADGFAGVALAAADDAILRNLAVTPGSVSGPGGADPTGVYLNASTVRLVGVSVADAPGLALYATGDSTAVGEDVRLGGARSSSLSSPSDILSSSPSVVSFESRDVALDAAAEVPPLPTDRRVVGDPVFAVPTSDDARLSLSVGYDDAAVEDARTTEESLWLWRFDAGEGWRRVEKGLDADRNAARATVGNLSEEGTVLALVGEESAQNETAVG